MAKKMICTLKTNRPNKGSEPEFFPLPGGIGGFTLVPGEPQIVGGGALLHLQQNFKDDVIFEEIVVEPVKKEEMAKPKKKTKEKVQEETSKPSFLEE